MVILETFTSTDGITWIQVRNYKSFSKFKLMNIWQFVGQWKNNLFLQWFLGFRKSGISNIYLDSMD